MVSLCTRTYSYFFNFLLYNIVMAEKEPNINILRKTADIGYSILRPRMSLKNYDEKDDFIAISSLAGAGLGVSIVIASGILRIGADITERLTGHEYQIISDRFFNNPIETIGGFMACGIAVSTYYAFASRYDDSTATPHNHDQNNQQ